MTLIEQVEAAAYSNPLHLQRHYFDLGYRRGDFFVKLLAVADECQRDRAEWVRRQLLRHSAEGWHGLGVRHERPRVGERTLGMDAGRACGDRARGDAREVLLEDRARRRPLVGLVGLSARKHSCPVAHVVKAGKVA